MNTIYFWDSSINHYRDSLGNIENDYDMLLRGYSFPPQSNVQLWTSQGLQLNVQGNPILLIGLIVLAIFIIK